MDESTRAESLMKKIANRNLMRVKIKKECCEHEKSLDKNIIKKVGFPEKYPIFLETFPV